jgi:Ca-activated chloride channel family protein
MRSSYQTLLLLVLIGLFTTVAFSQMAIPVRWDDPNQTCWSIRERNVEIFVRNQVSTVTVTDEVYNPCSNAVEIEYVFPLPPLAAIDQFTLVVDGRELTGQLLDAGQARQIYNDIVRRRRDPGLLEYAGYGLYRSSAFPLGPGKTAQLVIHYTATCEKDGDVVELWYPMSTGRFCAEPVERFRISADIQSDVDILNVYSPAVDLDLDRRGSDHVIASYTSRRYRPQSDFQLFYEESRNRIGATFLTYWPDRNEDGYYMLQVSPSPRSRTEAVLAKDIVIVLDRSGSMAGDKIVQAREAARYIIHNLNANDRFNLISYNSQTSPCFSGLRPVSRSNIASAMSAIDRIEADGSTNIYAALERGMDQFSSDYSSRDVEFARRRPSYLIFLTDGLPTTGNTSENDILSNTRKANRADVRLFAFGVGYDVNVRLLDNLVNQNHGKSGYVKPDEDIEAKVSALYRRIKNPFLTGLDMAFDRFTTRDDCPSELGDLFEGDQIIRVGRIRPTCEEALNEACDERAKALLTLSGSIDGESQTFVYPVTIDLHGASSSHRFLEKLWAARRVGQLMEDIQLHGRVQELVDELIKLSKKYGIVTPYTSFLADENRNFSDAAQIRQQVVGQAEISARAITGPQAQMNSSARQSVVDISSLTKLKSSDGHAMRMGATSQSNFEAGITESVNSIRVVGNVTLYRRGDAWVTSDVLHLDPVRDRGKFTVIQRFSDEYFALTRGNSPEENLVISSQETGQKLAILLRGTPYLIE